MMILPLRDAPELGGSDPIDARIGSVPASPPPRARRVWFRARLALGLSPTPVPGLVLLPIGIALGPHGIGVLSATALSYLDPVIAVALTALGTFIGLGLSARTSRERRLLSAASLEALLTVVVVVAGLYAALTVAWPGAPASPWVALLALAICASASSTTSTPGHGRMAGVAARIGDLDDVLPVVLGGALLARLHSPEPWMAASLFGQSIGLTLMVAIAGWMLVSAIASDSEQRVFALGALLLIAGLAEYLALSALMSGFVAGVFWNVAAPRVRDRIARDVRHIQHPLVVLLLLIAGARVQASLVIATLSLAYVLFRVIGKVIAGWFAARVAKLSGPSNLGVYLLSPGVIGVAFALNVVRVWPDETGGVLLSAVVFGSIGSELLSLVVHPREDGER
jgi:Kef-type K+ transport system membrane component KefB